MCEKSIIFSNLPSTDMLISSERLPGISHPAEVESEAKREKFLAILGKYNAHFVTFD
jgi:hypothetical protein